MTKIHCHGIVLLLLNGIQVVSLPMIFADNNFHAENLHLIMLSAIYNAAHVLHRCVIIIYAVMAWLMYCIGALLSYMRWWLGCLR